MSGMKTLDAARISELTAGVEGQANRESSVIAVSGAMYVDPTGNDAQRFNAALETAAGSTEAGISHLFMLDARSSTGVSTQLREAGAIIVPVARDEGGVALPYLTGASIIDQLITRGILPPDTLMVKVEGEKNVFGGRDTPDDYFNVGRRLNIATGIRSLNTWQTMPYFLRLTESVLGYAIGQALDITDDTPSGVLVLDGQGRELLKASTRNDWTYLIGVPFDGKRQGLNVGVFEIDFPYHRGVVEEENGNPAFDQKRRDQFTLMLEYAIDLATRHSKVPTEELNRLTGRFALALEGLASTST
jgi:hypothetical protein